MVDKTKQILLLCIILVQLTRPHDPTELTTVMTTPASVEACHSEYSFRYNVTWPRTTDKTISHPPCINEAEEFVYRECFNEQWLSEPECSRVQFETPPECPDGYSEIGDICYKFTSRTTWPPSCDFPDVLPFHTYIGSISWKIPEAVWMPVTRDLSNGYGFLQWVEASSYYKSPFESYFRYDGKIKGKDCLIYAKGGMIKAVNCLEKHRAVCAYRKLTKKERKICDEGCWQSSYASRNKCFCLKKDTDEFYSEAEFLEPYQNSLYSLITDETCNIGLGKKPDGNYYWSRSNQSISYTYWSENVTFNWSRIYGSSSSTGWLLTEEKQPCTLIEREIPVPELRIELTYNPVQKYLTLILSNTSLVQKFDDNVTIFCFTDAENASLVYRYADIIREDSFNFQPFGNGPGTYWCEVFQHLDLKVIQTQKQLVRDGTYFEFVVIFEVNNLPNGNPLSNKTMTFLKSSIVDKFSNSWYKYKPRIMKILDIFESNSMAWVNVHFSSNTNLSLSQLEVEYKYLLKEISSALWNTKNVNLLDVYNTDYCFSDVSYSPGSYVLKWAQSSLGDEVNPDKFCFTVNGKLVTRRCVGDFINGARWSYFEKCKVLDSSSLTNTFLDYYTDTISAVPETVNTILNRNSIRKVRSLDVFLIADILNSVYAADTIDIDTFVDTIDTMHSIDKCVIIDSQITARTTDSLLSLISNVVAKYPSSVERIEENFGLVIYPSWNISGVMIEKVGNVRQVTKLEGNWTLDKIKSKSNLESAVWLSPELQAMLSNDTKVAFTIFFNDCFFGESVSTSNVVNTVFGVTISDYSTYSFTKEPIRVIQKIENGDRMKRTCSSWWYQLGWQAGFWLKDGTYNNLIEYQLCDFYHTTNFAIVASYNEFVESVVTSNLAQLLDTEYVASDRVGMLVNISEQYDQFVPMDIFLVGKVLEAVNDNQETDLEALTRTVSNLHYTNRTVLSQSQTEKQATDNILLYIDSIIDNSNYTVEFLYKTDNFALFISDIRMTDFSALVVLETNESREIVVLRGNVTLDMIQSFENLDSAIVISTALSRQMVEDSKVIITIFFTDSLFNAESAQHTSISTIFGVLLPQIGNFSSPISIFHNISQTEDSLECSHWNYRQANQSISYWEKNDDGKNASNLIQCDFWHTTHFALLLLGKDKYYFSEQILEWITYINSTISFISLFGIIITAVLFKKWRKNIGNQILFNFTLAIMIQIIAFFGVSFIDQSENNFYCTLLGALLHYSVVAQFCWMLVIAVLQFKRFVKVFATSPKCLLLKTCLCGWGIPVVPVVLAWVLNSDNYYKSTIGFCYPSGYGLYLGVWLPLLIVITLNLCIFIYIMYNVIQRNIEPTTAPKNDAKYQWRLFVLLFFMLGMTWTFGFMAEADFGEVFAILFCLTATLQGFVLFLYFIVLNSNTRYMYQHAFKTYCRKDH